jgi:hypothetical protein
MQNDGKTDMGLYTICSRMTGTVHEVARWSSTRYSGALL